jgi:DNA polymerase III epsilon subunit-like protein
MLKGRLMTMPPFLQTVQLIEEVLEVDHAPTFAQVVPELTAALQGHYILSFNLDFDLGKLREHADRFGIEPLAVIGECLMRKAQRYFHQSSYPKLAELCRRIGFPLPDHPLQSAWDRARGQRHLLEAMSQGITFVQEPAQPTDLDNDEEEDEPPF